MSKKKRSDISSRSRNFAWILYLEEDIKHKQFFDFITTLSDVRPVWICHSEFSDNEKLEDGTDKKIHTHLVVHFSNARFLSPVARLADSMGVHHTELVNDLGSYIRYMLHWGTENKDKYEYQLDDLCGDADLIRLAVDAEVEDCTNSVKDLLILASKNYRTLDEFKLLYLSNHLEDFKIYKRYKELFDCVFFNNTQYSYNLLMRNDDGVGLHQGVNMDIINDLSVEG